MEGGALFLENKGEEVPQHKELALSNLCAGDPVNLYAGILYVLLKFSPPKKVLHAGWLSPAVYKSTAGCLDCLPQARGFTTGQKYDASVCKLQSHD